MSGRTNIHAGRRKDLARRYGLTAIGEAVAPCHWCGRLGIMVWRPGYYLPGPPWRKPETVYFEHHIDHLVPRSKGGTNQLTNLVLACAPCNLSRGAKHWIPPRLLQGVA